MKIKRNIKVKPGSLISHHLFVKRMTVGNPLSTNARIRISLSQKGISEDSLIYLPTHTDTPSFTSEYEFVWKLLYLPPNPLQKRSREQRANPTCVPTPRWHKESRGCDNRGTCSEGGPGKGLCFVFPCPSTLSWPQLETHSFWGLTWLSELTCFHC